MHEEPNDRCFGIEIANQAQSPGMNCYFSVSVSVTNEETSTKYEESIEYQIEIKPAKKEKIRKKGL